MAALRRGAPTEPPKLMDFLGVAPNLTGGLSSEDYVRKVRDAMEIEVQAGADELFEALGEGYGITRQHAEGLAFRVCTAMRLAAVRASTPAGPPEGTSK